ncbi:formate dehydrogenase accessory protein FdhE [Bartonella sp. DB5-6]|uniref:formate dehydrogenase accessory protein FdhE n=1 Tax=Bartonella sp. DB5-6 TaxID=1094755 RepID=UPI00026E8DFF|nr:formate dehydrogenase accessory protein FdhE [Bartonella sp. DB5-6]EJF79045.1 formate dehydrogenase accessory protein FdhE [Bartonella sp. DB5-6]
MPRFPENSGSFQKKPKPMNNNGITDSPIFTILPHKNTFFVKRAQRFAHLATLHPDKESLLFFACFCDAQQQLTEKFKDFAAPLRRFGAPSGPPLDRSKLLTLGFYESIVEDFLKHLSTPTVFGQGLSTTRQEALKRTQQQKDQWRLWGDNLLNHRLPQQQLAEHLFIIGALQILYSLAASQFDAQSLNSQHTNLCPACSGTHTASLIIERKPHETVKVCSCLYCGTLWHIPHTQCTFCKATQNISTHTTENIRDGIVFETCETCGFYCKQLNHYKNPTLDVFADDISTSTPDFLHKASFHFKNKSFNPFLAKHKK